MAFHAGAAHNQGIALISVLAKKLNAMICGNQSWTSATDGMFNNGWWFSSRNYPTFNGLPAEHSGENNYKQSLADEGKWTKANLNGTTQTIQGFILIHSEKFILIKNKTHYLGAFIVLLSCCSHRISDGGRQKHFYDIDLFTLKGLGQMDQIQYPFIVVDSLSESRKMVKFCYSENIRDSVVYHFRNNSWQAYSSFWADTGKMTVVTNIFPDKIIWLRYLGEDSISRILSSFTVFKNNHEYTYGLRMAKTRAFGEFDLALIRDTMNTIVEDSFVIKHGMLTKFSKNEDFLNNDVARDTICYPIKDHSIFWWLSFEKFIDMSKTKCN